jgi:hypothetical protein
MAGASDSVEWILTPVDLLASLFMFFVFFVVKSVAVFRFKETL